ncbi:MAG: hypothetical protein AAB538_01455, partial [Patescibacteria group bacterium]
PPSFGFPEREAGEGREAAACVTHRARKKAAGAEAPLVLLLSGAWIPFSKESAWPYADLFSGCQAS